MATLDEICEIADEFEASGDTPIRFKFDGLWLAAGAITKEPNGTLVIELEDEEI